MKRLLARAPSALVDALSVVAGAPSALARALGALARGLGALAAVVAPLLVVGMPALARADDSAPPSKPERMLPLRVRAFGGVAHGSLFGLPITGATAGASIGAGVVRDWGGLDSFVDATYDAMSTEHGVGVHRFALGATAELFVWHLRFGVGPDAGLAWLARLSGSKLSARELYGGLHATAGIDLFTSRGFTPYLQARAEYNTVLPTFAGSAGVRYAF